MPSAVSAQAAQDAKLIASCSAAIRYLHVANAAAYSGQGDVIRWMVGAPPEALASASASGYRTTSGSGSAAGSRLSVSASPPFTGAAASGDRLGSISQAGRPSSTGSFTSPSLGGAAGSASAAAVSAAVGILHAFASLVAVEFGSKGPLHHAVLGNGDLHSSTASASGDTDEALAASMRHCASVVQPLASWLHAALLTSASNSSGGAASPSITGIPGSPASAPTGTGAGVSAGQLESILDGVEADMGVPTTNRSTGTGTGGVAGGPPIGWELATQVRCAGVPGVWPQQTLLHLAATAGSVAVVRPFASLIASTGAGTGMLRDLLCGAALANHADVIASLVTHSASGDSRGSTASGAPDDAIAAPDALPAGRSALHYAAIAGAADALDALLAAPLPLPADGSADEAAQADALDARLRIRDAGGMTPLHYAAAAGSVGACAVLLKHAAYVTALRATARVAKTGDSDAPSPVPTGTGSGAQSRQPYDSLRDGNGRTALDIARAAGHVGLIQLLSSWDGTSKCASKSAVRDPSVNFDVAQDLVTVSFTLASEPDARSMLEGDSASDSGSASASAVAVNALTEVLLGGRGSVQVLPLPPSFLHHVSSSLPLPEADASADRELVALAERAFAIADEADADPAASASPVSVPTRISVQARWRGGAVAVEVPSMLLAADAAQYVAIRAICSGMATGRMKTTATPTICHITAVM